MKRLIFTILILLFSTQLLARERLQGWCQDGGIQAIVPGTTGTTEYIQQSFPSCTVTVYLASTLTLATIFSDATGTLESNPFTADSTGRWSFYADGGRYDIRFSDGGITTPFTLGDFVSQELLSPRDFGAIGDGVVDDTQAWLDMAAAASAGSLIHVNGTYRIAQQIAFANSVTLTGPGTLVDLRPIDADSNDALIRLDASDSRVLNLTFDGASAPTGSLGERKIVIGINTQGAAIISRFWIQNNRFMNFDRKGTVDAGGDASTMSERAINVESATDVWITDNYIEDVSGVGVFVRESSRVHILRNTVLGIASGDMLYHIHLNHTCNDVWIEDNYITQGERASGGAIDVMSAGAGGIPAGINREVHVRGNTIENTPGFGSGSAVIRFLSVENGTVEGNIIRNIPVNGDASAQSYIGVNRRTGAAGEQPGPVNNIVANNILVASAQAANGLHGINVANGSAGEAQEGGDRVIVANNNLVTDGTNYFGRGIRVLDIRRAIVQGNYIDYSYNANADEPWGIIIAEVRTRSEYNKVIGNIVEANSSALSRGIYLDADIIEPTVEGNTVLNTQTHGIRVDAEVVGASVINNVITVAGGASISPALNDTRQAWGNRFDPSDSKYGTWTMTAGTNNVVVSTTEVMTGDRIHLTITSGNSTDAPVKVDAVTDSTSFRIRTVDHATLVTNNMTGTWFIEH